MSEPARGLRVAIIGGGITGLAAAHALERARREQGAAVEYALFEASARLGGNLRTEREGEFVIEAGPDGFVANKPWAEALCHAVGLGPELIETLPENRRVYGVHRGELVPFPEGVMLTAPTRVGPMLRTPLISWRGKLRMALDLVLPARTDSDDESLASFVARRLGPEAVEAFAEPLMAGIHAGDAAALSIRSTFPQLVAMERERGGLIRGARAMQRARRRPAGTPPPSAFLSLRNGMGSLPAAVAAQLAPGSVHTGARIERLVRGDGSSAPRWRVQYSGGASFDADAVVMAIPSAAAARLLEEHQEEAAALLREVPQLSTATVYLAFEREQIPHPLDATGVVVPRREQRRITASTWASSKWPGRAPAGSALLRAFFGGARAPEATDADDSTLVRIAREELGSLLGVRGEPQLARVFRYPRANPQMIVGHAERMRRVRARLGSLGGIHVAGGGYDGVGIPDSIRQGEAVAAQLLATLPPR